MEIAMDLELFKMKLYVAIQILTDAIFITDIAVNFNTTIDQGEKVVYDRRVITRNYLRGRFTVDLLSAIPLDNIVKLLSAGRL